MSDTKVEIFEKILALRKEQEYIGKKIAMLHEEMIQEDLREMGISI